MPVVRRHTIAGAGLWALYYGGETVRNGVDLDAVTAAADLAYPLENVEVRFVRRDPAGVPTGWWRGVGPTRSVFAVESLDRKSTRLNSSHSQISYAVFCLKKKTNEALHPNALDHDLLASSIVLLYTSDT